MRTQHDLAEDFRRLADFLDANPEDTVSCYPTIHVFFGTKEKIADFARKNGNLKKEYMDSFFALNYQFGKIELKVCIEREKVCRLVEKIVTKTLPAEAAKPATEALPERTVEIVEKSWDCAEPLLAPDPSIVDRPVTSPLLS